MKKRYAYIDCFEELREIPFKNPLIKYFGEKAIKNHIIKRFPFCIEDIFYANKEGYHIKIPFINTFENEEDYYISKFFQAFNQNLLKYDIDILVLNEALKKYSYIFNITVSRGKTLGTIYIDKILEEIKKEIITPEKNIRYVIVDGITSDSEFILDHITDNINSLILVTDNPIRYEEKIQEIYNETGLAIEIKDKSLHQNIEGDIIIQCNKNKEKLFYCYGNNSFLIDFISDEDAINQIKIKREDLKIMSKFEPIYLDEKWNPDLLLGIMLNEERFLKNMYIHGYRYSTKEKIDNILSRYPVNFRVY